MGGTAFCSVGGLQPDKLQHSWADKQVLNFTENDVPFLGTDLKSDSDKDHHQSLSKHLRAPNRTVTVTWLSSRAMP